MNKLKNYTVKLKFLFFIVLLIMVAASCKQEQHKVVKVANKSYYTCSMHPQIHEDHPGDCPICGMELIKVKEAGTMAGSNQIVLTAAQIRLASIQTDTARQENTGAEKTLTGTVTTNENTAEELSARIAGRIQRLFIRTTGEKIAVGQPIYAIYSEDLLEAEKEYLLARQQQKVLHNPDIDYQQLISAAANKLQLWGLSAAQIKTLASSGQASATTNILSSISGTVSEIAVHEGDYVTEGSSILKTQALNDLWVEAQIYASETGNYKVNDRVHLSFPDLGGQLINGKVEFINPELADDAKVDLVRISVPNPQGLIRPGMLGYISITHGNNRSLAIQASAVLTNGKGSSVWVKNANGSFSPRMITTASGNQSYIAVLSGLNAGEIVVVNGAYLLNSEAVFKNGDENMGMKM